MRSCGSSRVGAFADCTGNLIKVPNRRNKRAFMPLAYLLCVVLLSFSFFSFLLSAFLFQPCIDFLLLFSYIGVVKCVFDLAALLPRFYSFLHLPFLPA